MKQRQHVSNKRGSGRLKTIRFPHPNCTETFTCANERLSGMPRAIRKDCGESRGPYKERKPSQTPENNAINQLRMENPPDDSVQCHEPDVNNDFNLQVGGDDFSEFDFSLNNYASSDMPDPLSLKYGEFFKTPGEDLPINYFDT